MVPRHSRSAAAALWYDPALQQCHRAARALDADLAIVGSYVPDGIAVAELVLRTAGGLIAFYDIDTPVTLAALAAERCDT